MIAARLAACLIPLALIAACGRVESAPSSRLVPEWFVGDGGRVPRYVESSLDRGGIADGGTLYRLVDDRLRFEIVRNDSLGISMGGFLMRGWLS